MRTVKVPLDEQDHKLVRIAAAINDERLGEYAARILAEAARREVLGMQRRDKQVPTETKGE